MDLIKQEKGVDSLTCILVEKYYLPDIHIQNIAQM